MKLFGTDGIRGTANQYPITPELALRLGRVIPRSLTATAGKVTQVLIGRDTRVSGTMLENALCSGLLSEGIEVLLVGVLPTPAVAYLTRELGCDAGIMLTASHNPFQDNGIKIFGADGYKLNDDLEASIEAQLLGDELTGTLAGSSIGSVTTIIDATERYCEFAKQSITGLNFNGLKIVVDAAHGAGYSAGPQIFEQLGAEVITVGVEPSGVNINEGVGSLHPEVAAKAVRDHGADLGVCLDGDADRLALINELGEVVDGDALLCLCALAMKRRGELVQDTLVATVMSNLGLKEALSQNGIALEITGVGDRLVLERMREKGLALGGENSGHIIFSHHATTGDGIMAALQILADMKSTGQRLSQLADCLNIFPQKLVNLAVKEKPPLQDIAGLGDLITKAEASMADTGRVLIRYSGTEKKIRVMVEARDAEIMADWCTQFVTLIQTEIGA